MEVWKPKVLLLGPGGVKGFLMLGSLLFLEKTRLFKEIKKIVGISIGAVIGLFYIIGCNMTEILEISLMTHLNEVITSIDVINIMKTNGLVSHDIFRKRMRDKIIQKYGFVPTLQQLHFMTGYEFEIVVTNLDKDETEYFSHLTEPDLCCVEAVLMSMSLPLFFQTYVYKNNIYLDGAITEPFPIHKYKDDNVFGIMMNGSPSDPKESFFNYLSRVIHTFTSTKEKMITIPQNAKVLKLEYQINDAIGVKLTFEKRVEMVLIGYLRAYEFYQQLHEKSPNDFPINYNRINSKEFFLALPYSRSKTISSGEIFVNKKQIEDDIDSEKIEDEGDDYLMELFEDSDTTDDSSSTDYTTEENSEEEQEYKSIPKYVDKETLTEYHVPELVPEPQIMITESDINISDHDEPSDAMTDIPDTIKLNIPVHNEICDQIKQEKEKETIQDPKEETKEKETKEETKGETIQDPKEETKGETIQDPKEETKEKEIIEHPETKEKEIIEDPETKQDLETKEIQGPKEDLETKEQEDSIREEKEIQEDRVEGPEQREDINKNVLGDVEKKVFIDDMTGNEKIDESVDSSLIDRSNEYKESEIDERNEDTDVSIDPSSDDKVVKRRLSTPARMYVNHVRTSKDKNKKSKKRHKTPDWIK